MSKIKATGKTIEIPLSHEEQEKKAAEKAVWEEQCFVQSVDWAIAHNRGKVDVFIVDLANDAIYAFEWSAEVIHAAARLKTYIVLQREIAEIGVEAAKAKVRKQAEDAAFRGALWPHSSTSQISNLAEQAKVQAWAEMAQFLGRKL
jgi:hypothetical protein